MESAGKRRFAERLMGGGIEVQKQRERGVRELVGTCLSSCHFGCDPGSNLASSAVYTCAPPGVTREQRTRTSPQFKCQVGPHITIINKIKKTNKQTDRKRMVVRGSEWKVKGGQRRRVNASESPRGLSHAQWMPSMKFLSEVLFWLWQIPTHRIMCT